MSAIDHDDHIPRRDRSRRRARREVAHRPGSETVRLQFDGARRGNHEVMMRGTFANIRLRNALSPGKEGWWTATAKGADPSRCTTPQCGTRSRCCRCSSCRQGVRRAPRATGPRRERPARHSRRDRGVLRGIHRSNLVGMGVLPRVRRGCDAAVARSHRLRDLHHRGNVGRDEARRAAARAGARGCGAAIRGAPAHRHAPRR